MTQLRMVLQGLHLMGPPCSHGRKIAWWKSKACSFHSVNGFGDVLQLSASEFDPTGKITPPNPGVPSGVQTAFVIPVRITGQSSSL